LSKTRYLPDVNVLLALTMRGHEFYSIATKWFEARGSSELLLCPLTEASFLRLATEPKVGNKQLRDAIFLLREFSSLPGFRYLPIPDSWLNLTSPFMWRLHGHKQVTDAYLLGLAIHENAVLVTLDTRIQSWAAPDYNKHLLTLPERA
jgi:toxin-antitoxin system PIN domain toxin